MGGVVLLALVFVLSAFLDNIASAIIGGVVARHVFKGRVSIRFLAAIVAGANAGGAGSAIGDTTTTMIWISGVSPLELAAGFIGAAVAFLVFAAAAAMQPHRLPPISRTSAREAMIDWGRVLVVLLVLTVFVTTNVVANRYFPGSDEVAPVLGLGLWAAILGTSLLRPPQWSVAIDSLGGAFFLVLLVALASLMPLNQLPHPSLEVVLGLGILSSVFDNIPLTALAIRQGGYDWALLAYAVGFGGSMIWFGSSSGVALTGLYPEARSTVAWVRAGWFIPLAYQAGFAAMALTQKFYL